MSGIGSLLGRRFNKLLAIGRNERSKTAATENLIATVGFSLVVYSFNPTDPLLLQQPFPWLILPSLFIALRHGFAHGIVSSLMMTALVFMFWRLGFSGVEAFPGILVLGMMICVSLAGEFRDMWHRQVVSTSMEVVTHRQRLDEFAQAYHILKLSYDHLMERFGASEVSLRSALTTMEQELSSLEEQGDPLERLSEPFIHLMGRFAMVQSAALLKTNDREQLILSPLAVLGDWDGKGITESHPMIQLAMETKEMVSLKQMEPAAMADADSPAHLICVIPLCDVQKRMYGMTCVQKMPFTSFEGQTLKLLAIMGSYMGDMLAKAPLASSEEHLNDLFVREIETYQAYSMEYDLISHIEIITLQGKHDQLVEASQFLISTRRGLDKVTLREKVTFRELDEAHMQLIWLLPMTDTVGLQGFQRRMERMVKEKWGTQVQTSFRSIPLLGDQPIQKVVAQLESP